MISGEDPRAQAEPVYAVVVNDDHQYSIWPGGATLPAGWHREGTTGTRDECLRHIGDVWTDMRPASLRRGHDDGGKGSQ